MKSIIHILNYITYKNTHEFIDSQITAITFILIIFLSHAINNKIIVYVIIDSLLEAIGRLFLIKKT